MGKRCLFFLLIAGGCATKGTTIEEALMHYHTYLRAHEISKAMVFVAPEALESFHAMHDPQRNIYLVEEVEIGAISKDQKTSNTVVQVLLTIRTKNSITVKTKRIREEWQKRKNRWYLVKLEEQQNERE